MKEEVKVEETAVDIEAVMQEIRRQIVARKMPGQERLPPVNKRLPPQFYEHLYQASLMQSQLGVKTDVTKTAVPLIGPAVDWLRGKFHQLVIFYINQVATQQAEINDHVLRALEALSEAVAVAGEGGAAAPEAPEAAVGAAPRQDAVRATEDDVYYCYRLFLNREPDARGWQYWTHLVQKHHIALDYLVDSFLTGHEFQALRAERNRPQLVELPDFQIYVRSNDNFIGAAIARTHSYEPHVTRCLRRLLQPGHHFVDVGANIGYFALLAAAVVGPPGHVYAFEPNADNCALLRQSITANDFGARVTLWPNAVAEAAQSFHFATAGADSNGRIVNDAEAAEQAVALPTVEAVTLDEALHDAPRIDVVKIDAEGAEARVWQGMQAVVQRHRPTLVFEFSPALLRRTSLVEPQAFLSDVQAHYDLFVIGPDGELSAEAQTAAAIVQQHAAADATHLDLVARPRGRGATR